MKKLLLSLCIAILGLVSSNAQIEAGAYVGAPIGDSDGFSFNAGATFGYYFQIIEPLKIGGIVGVDHFFGKEYDMHGLEFDAQDATFIPLAASAKFSFASFFAGLDLGYAIPVSDGAGDGGFLVRPRFGYSIPLIDVYVFYKSISYAYDYVDYEYDGFELDDSFNVGSIGVGAAFKF